MNPLTVQLFAGTLGVLALPFALAGCGGSGTTSDMGHVPAPIHTLAYVVSECRDVPPPPGHTVGPFFERYALVVRDGEHAPVTVAEIPELGPVQPPVSLGCRYWGHVLFGGHYSMERGGFTKLGVSPDGSTVVFEETDELSAVFPHDFLPPEQKGIFSVRADGKGLRRLGPPAREPTWAPILVGQFFFNITFSPDGRTIAFPDIGPGPTGDSPQIFTMDLASGTRKQITQLPLILPTEGAFGLPAVFGPIFLDNETIAFFTSETTLSVAATVKVDGSDLKVPAPPVPTPGVIVPRFQITGDRLAVFQSYLLDHGHASGPTPFFTSSFPLELFAFDGSNLLQLTTFGRADTGLLGALVGPDEDHVFFTASADPFGTNPSENCQIFSIDRLGRDLRQLTDFHTAEHSVIGCTSYPSTQGCAPFLQAQDAISGTLVFSSGCGTNPSSSQIFSVRPDGSGLRQLTNLRGTFTDAEGAFHAELPGPWAYGPYVPGGTSLP